MLAFVASFLTIGGPLLIAFGQQQLGYTLVDPACRSGAQILVHVPALLGLVLLAVLARVAWREADGSREGAPTDDADPLASPRFFGLVGVLLSALAAALILAQWLPTLFLDPCRR